ncbi:hypothetical protein pdam_00012447 [Pocillopora damicornis]|uniref:Uncharacterized protein n=1 Tax=Pocillopora damicornis TaxID=46731 RepID=A0A3M6TBH6_POCDA|nr:hypothetical protein pdam_00012447 [Pocillopora damicornis]
MTFIQKVNSPVILEKLIKIYFNLTQANQRVRERYENLVLDQDNNFYLRQSNAHQSTPCQFTASQSRASQSKPRLLVIKAQTLSITFSSNSQTPTIVTTRLNAVAGRYTLKASEVH